MHKLFLTLALFLTAAFAQAADFTGTWKGEVTTPNGDKMPVSYTLKQDGATLTGSAIGPQGDTMAIADGKVEGDKITFILNVPMNGGMKIAHTGVLEGEQLKVSLSFGEQAPMTVVLKKI